METKRYENLIIQEKLDKDWDDDEADADADAIAVVNANANANGEMMSDDVDAGGREGI